jgi:flagellar biosynthesis component FlhA
VIVTTTAARHAVRDVLASEFPDVPILARSELTPGVEVQSLGRIGFATRESRTTA